MPGQRRELHKWATLLSCCQIFSIYCKRCHNCNRVEYKNDDGAVVLSKSNKLNNSMAPKKRALEEPAASAAGEAKKAHVENDTKEVS